VHGDAIVHGGARAVYNSRRPANESVVSERQHHRLIVLGSGPAGYTATLYAARANLQPALITGVEVGGQLTTTTEVENWPGGHAELQGPELMSQMAEHVERFEATIINDYITQADLSGQPLLLDGDKTYSCDALIIATGASAKYLGLDNEKRLLGRGVSACATCDGAFFRGVEIAIVGGGDTAMEEALFLTRFATKVYIIHRRDALRASKIMQQRVFNNEKIEILWNTVVTDVLGENDVQGVRLKDTITGEARELPVTGFFVAIGHRPNTDIFKGWLDMDEQGYIQTRPGSTYTNIPGVFASGDAQDHVYRQAVTAAGTGCMAAIDAERWMAEQEAEAKVHAAG